MRLLRPQTSLCEDECLEWLLDEGGLRLFRVPWTTTSASVIRIFSSWVGSTSTWGAQTTRVLVTALHAMGLTDLETYGTTDKGSGPLDGVLSPVYRPAR